MLNKSPKHILAACALIWNQAGDVLLVRTERRGWEIPGGQIEEGETLIQGLQREIYEESGVRVSIGRLAVVNSNLDRSVMIFGFQAQYLDGELRPSSETPEVRWANPKLALSLITHSAAHQRVRDMVDGRQRALYRAYRTNPYRIIESRELY